MISSGGAEGFSILFLFSLGKVREEGKIKYNLSTAKTPSAWTDIIFVVNKSWKKYNQIIKPEVGEIIMSRILFLDIDGVLNSDFWNDRHQTEISDGTLIDEEKIKLLAHLVRETNSEIILHSGWRFWFDSELKPLRKEAKNLVELLEKEDLHISGATPDLTTEEIRKTKKFSLVKADEILLWIKLHKNVTEWVVLDDLDLHNAQIEQHQVKPDQTEGLTPDNVKQAIKILLG